MYCSNHLENNKIKICFFTFVSVSQWQPVSVEVTQIDSVGLGICWIVSMNINWVQRTPHFFSFLGFELS